MHHADSFLEPLVEDMVDLGIDVWQGVLPQNDIVKLQERKRELAESILSGDEVGTGTFSREDLIEILG